MLTFNITNRRFHKYRHKLIDGMFNFIIEKRIENKTILKLFYRALEIAFRFYFEPPYKKERQHYIPKFILRNFAIPSTGCLYEYSYDRASPKKASIDKEVAFLWNFYSFNKTHGRGYSNFTEKNILAEIIENYSSRVIQDIVDSKYGTTISLEENMIAHYAAFQYVRTPTFHIQLKLFLLYLIEEKKLDLKYFKNKNKFKFNKMIINNYFNVNNKDLKNFFYNNVKHNNVGQRLSQYIDNTNHIVLNLANLIGSSIIEPIFRKKMYVINASAPFYFMMPDTGVLVFDFSDENNLWPYGWDFWKKEMALIVPVSPDICIVFTDSDMDEKLKEEYIKLAMGSVYYQKNKYIYSDRKELLIQNNINKMQ